MMDLMWIILGMAAVIAIPATLFILLRRSRNYAYTLEEKLRKTERDKMRSSDKQRAVIKGHLAEQFFPFGDYCAYFPSDMRFLGDFCDYICVDGYTDCKDNHADRVGDVVFIEIKTGKSQLSRHQKLIRDAIQEGRVRWETVHIP